MADIKIATEWIEQADEDFLFALSNLEEQDKFYAKICFHFQQAGEKYLKAFIILHDLPFKKIHNLVLLLEICSKKDDSFNELLEETKVLNVFYIDTRYPAFWPIGTTREEAEKAKEAAEKIGKFVKGKIKR